MKILTRDVVLLGSAATTFLLLAFASPVGAGDDSLSAGSLPGDGTPVTLDPPPVDAKPAASGPARPEVRVEKACDRVERIGKFTITRCN